MSMRLMPHLAKTESGVPWLGAVPDHWQVLPHRALFQERIDRGHEGEQLLSVTISKGVISQEQLLASSSKKDSSNLDKSAYKLVHPGDVVYNKMRMWQGAVGRAGKRGLVSPAYIVVSPRDPAVTDTSYYHYLFRTPLFTKEAYRHSYGICDDQLSLRYEDFKTIVSPVPPIGEQAHIAEFAAYVNRCIGRAIAAKRREIELLNEQKQTIINSVVTRGLSPDVVLKPSAIDWVPRIPEHWTSVRVRSIASSLQTGPFGSQLHSDEYRPDGVPVINPSHMKGGKICPDQECAVSPAKADQLSRHRLLEGDIVFARRGELGRCALVTEQEVGWICGTGSLRARLADGVAHPAYMLELLLSKGVSEWLSLQSVGSTMENLNTSILARLPLPLPPKSEQHAIAGFVHEQRSLIDTAIRHVTQQIALLREYRTRLIADVVTGKLDVRGVELPHLEDSDIADDLCDSAFDLGTDRDDLPDAEEVEADDED